MRFVPSSLLGVGCLLSLLGFSQSDNSPQLTIEPRYLQFADKGRDTLVLCTLKDPYGKRIPLAGCQFKSYNSVHFWDFNMGGASPRTLVGMSLGSYHGNGLQQGECGISIANHRTYGNLILGCRVQPASGGAWLYETMMLYATPWAPLQFNLDPPGVTLALPGTDVTFNGKADRIIDVCLFFLPSADNPVKLDFKQGSASTSHSLGQYHGAGLQRQECGVTLRKVTSALSGYVIARISSKVGSVSSSTFVELIVATAPELPRLTVRTTATLYEGDTLHAICVVRNSRPVANITWYVGDNVVRQDSINEAPLESKWRWSHDLQTIEQHLKYVVGSSDHNKKLKCTSSHVTLIAGPQDSTLYQIRVNRRMSLESTTVRSVPAEQDPCNPNPCGENSECEQAGPVVINCSCKKKYLGNPPNCRPECTSNRDCSSHRTCVDTECLAACDLKVCGVGAECHLKGNTGTVCKCLDDFVGNPDVRCEKDDNLNCGKRTVPPASGVGVQNATIEEFPWYVGLYALIDGNNNFVCGGTLIRRNIVVTAAHCVYSEARRKVQNATELKVTLGKLHLDYNDDLGSNSLQIVGVESIHVPTEYRGLQYSFEDDIAVLKLASMVRLTDAVNVACVDWNEIPSRGLRDPRWAKVNSIAAVGTIAGWSRDHDPAGGPVALQLLNLVWVKKETCYDGTPSDSQQLLTDDKFCASFVGQNVLCQVISGAGFMLPANGSFYLRGVAGVHLSYPEPKACNEERYGAFTMFSKHKAWVQSKFFN